MRIRSRHAAGSYWAWPSPAQSATMGDVLIRNGPCLICEVFFLFCGVKWRKNVGKRAPAFIPCCARLILAIIAAMLLVRWAS